MSKTEKRFGNSKVISTTHDNDGVTISEGKKIGRSFYRGENCNFNPYKRDFLKDNFLQNYVLKGLTPAAPFINEDTKITAFGSCFAENISKYLSKIGYNVSKDKHPDVYISSIGEGLVNVHALLSQFKWAFDDIAPSQELWHGYKTEVFEYNEEIRQKTKQVFLETDLFVITLGLSEVWYDEITNEVFWRAVPESKVDPTRHKFRVCGMQETKECLQQIKNYINKFNPNAKLLFTLSPVPLAATFRPVNCISANAVSKAILRAAVDELLRDNIADVNNNLFYWPSYEIVTELFYEKFTEDNRHPNDEILNLIMRMFESIYCTTSLDISDIEVEYKQSRISNYKKINI